MLMYHFKTSFNSSAVVCIGVVTMIQMLLLLPTATKTKLASSVYLYLVLDVLKRVKHS